MAAVQRGNSDDAWDAFLARYRRLIFATIQHYAHDYDDVMDVFARVCDALRDDDLKRLRTYLGQRDHRAKFSTWLVVVIRNLTIDWFRSREGRRRLSAVVEGLPALRRQIFELVFLDQRKHVEAYETLRTRDAPGLSFREFLHELRETYLSVKGSHRGSLLGELYGAAPTEAEIEASDPADHAARARLLMEAMATLDPVDRLVVQLSRVDELPAEDVARITGLPNVKAVYNRLYRALATLRERLEAAGVRRGDL